MPDRAPRICACGYRIAPGEACPCERGRAADRKRRHDQKRPSAGARGYDRKWRMERARFLRTFPFCAMCGKKAHLVDHVVPHKGDSRLFWDTNNWQALCSGCHSQRKQRMEKSAPGEGFGLLQGSTDRRAGSRANSMPNRDMSGGKHRG